jgi:hypothetical protein
MFSLDANRLTGLDCGMDECGCTVGSVNWQFGGGERILVYFALLLGILCACGSLVYADYGV